MIAFSVSVAHSEDYHFLYKWGDKRPDLSTQLNIARGVTTDHAGNVYVSDTYNNRIVKYDSNGTILWTRTNCNGSPINYPMELAVDSNNRVYFADKQNNRIVYFDSQGNCMGTIGSYGAAKGQLNNPLGVAFDASNNLYVTDRKNRRIQKFSWNGSSWAWSSTFGPSIAGYGTFGALWGIVIDGNNIYVTDEAVNKVVKLDLNGNYITRWGGSGIGNGQFFLTGGIAVDTDHKVYVNDIEHHRLQRFFPDGQFDTSIGERGTGNGQLQFSSAVAIDKNNGWIYVADDDNSRIVKFDLSGNYLDQWGCDSFGDTGLRYPTKIGLDRDNKVMYVVDSGNQRVIKMNLSMRVLGVWGSYGDGNGQFRYPIAAAVDKSGNVYVIDNVNRNVQKFLPDGTFQAKWQINFDPLKYRYGLHGIAVDSGGNIYVVDADTDKLYKLDPSGNKLAGWNIDYYSTGVALDEKNGFIYVSGFNVGRPDEDSVIQYDMTGNPTGKIIGHGTLYHPFDVTVEENGNIYVADSFNNKVAKFDPATGNQLASWGSTGGIYDPGTENSKFSLPYGIALDKSGNVYVADTHNHRIQKFTPDLYTVDNTAPKSCPATNLKLKIDIVNWGAASCDVTSTVTVTEGFSLFTVPSSQSRTIDPALIFQPAWNALSPLAAGNYSVNISSSAAIGDFDNTMPVSVVSSPTFADVPCGQWAYGWIEKFYDAGITVGCSLPPSPLDYCPETTVTRDQMAVFIVKTLFGVEPVCNGGVLCKNTSPYFSDVSSDHWAFKYIQKMKETGITAGCSVGNPLYCPGTAVSRDQMAVFVIKARQAEPYSNSTTTFADVPLNYWAFSYIEALSRLGITSGCGSGYYCPGSPVTRAQMAVFITKAFL